MKRFNWIITSILLVSIVCFSVIIYGTRIKNELNNYEEKISSEENALYQLYEDKLFEMEMTFEKVDFDKVGEGVNLFETQLKIMDVIEEFKLACRSNDFDVLREKNNEFEKAIEEYEGALTYLKEDNEYLKSKAKMAEVDKQVDKRAEQHDEYVKQYNKIVTSFPSKYVASYYGAVEHSTYDNSK